MTTRLYTGVMSNHTIPIFRSSGESVLPINECDGIVSLEVLPLLAQDGVAVRSWGKHNNIVNRLMLTSTEALNLAAALVRAATESIEASKL